MGEVMNSFKSASDGLARYVQRELESSFAIRLHFTHWVKCGQIGEFFLKVFTMGLVGKM